jgi:DNA-directed RNA polymerase specialized sigma24 family protein
MAPSQALMHPLPPKEPGVLPQIMDEASTHGPMLSSQSADDASSRWTYYQQPVRNYLKGLGCSPQDLDDLTHDSLIKLQTSIILNYDPQRPFRPYFKAVIRHVLFDRLRSLAPARAAGGTAPRADEESHVLVDGLLEYARQIYELFALDAPRPVAAGVGMLHAWLIQDQGQDALAGRWNLSARQIRTQIGRAADALSAWMQDRIHHQDLASLAAIARRQGIELDLGMADIRGLFTHISKRKRIRALMILALIYRKCGPLHQQDAQADGASGCHALS